jgi:predicted transcriptional regulator
MLEHWDEFIDVICLELNNNQQESVNKKSELFKHHVCKYISKSKFNIKNIIKFIKNNIHDITENEIKNMIASFEFLNTFGI